MGMNQKMNIPEMRRVMMEFEKQNELMGMKEEIMNDTIDGMNVFGIHAASTQREVHPIQ